MIPMLDLLVEAAGAHGVEEIVIGMAHRGRLNVLVNIMGKNVREIFAAFDDKHPERFLGARRREVPPRLLERPSSTHVGQHGAPLAGVQPEPPRVREPGRRGPRAREAGPRASARA